MKYTLDERLDIGRRVYDNELNKQEAAQEYEVSVSAIRDYMRLYRDTHRLPAKKKRKAKINGIAASKSNQTMEDLNGMTKEELIRELILARINEARLKKGYMVKGDGSNKQFILLGSKNTK